MSNFLFSAWLILSLVLIPQLSEGQSGTRRDKLYDKALRAYQSGDYAAARLALGKIESESSGNLSVCLLMADICHEQRQLEEEMIWLKRSSQISGAPALVYYRMADACYRLERYEEGLEFLNKPEAGKMPETIRVKSEKLRSNLRVAANAAKKPVRFIPEPLDSLVNSSYDDYWPSLTIDNKMLVFTRLLPVSDHPALKQEDFYYSIADSSGWQPALPVSRINSPLNEGAQTLSADGKLLFFTLCNHPGGKGSCDIWFSRLVNGEWTAPQNAGEPVNTPAWDGQPSFSAFGNILYFSSSRPGGRGNKDLWSLHLNGWDKLGNPVWSDLTHLDDSINTSGDEISPFIHSNGKDLYFSSDTWPGFGGLDLFHATKKSKDSWSKPINLGYPINSPGNEQGLIIDRTGKTAFFATNRTPTGNMDIYRFETDTTFRPAPVTFVRGMVKDANTGNPVKANIRINSLHSGQSLDSEVSADDNGIFLVTLPPVNEVLFTVNEPGYLFYSEKIDLTGTSSELSPLERTVNLIPAKNGTTVTLYNIFFPTGEYSILPESEPELNTLLDFMRHNPGLAIEIGGHTDNVGTGPFNLELSGKRANAVKEYLLNQGIVPSRISVKGYGMELPVASNESEEGRSKNRRTTIRIIN
ncbi:MAG TPA: OmpA family protein [Prolixibacteraceae bacterium]|nr:OmpA family protein [Prolixibacteraceae bacterium]